MAKIQIAAPASQKDELLRFLQEEEVVHVVETQYPSQAKKIGQAPQEETDTAYRLAQVQFALEFVKRVRGELNEHDKRNLRNIFAGKPVASLDELESVIERLNLEALLSDAHAMSEELTGLQAKLETYAEQLQYLEPWRALSLRGDDLVIDASVKHWLLQVVIRDEALFNEGLSKIPTAVWQEVNRVAQKKSVLVYGELVAHVDDARAVNDLLNDGQFEVVTIELDEDMNIPGRIESLRDKKVGAEKNYQTLLEKARDLFPVERDLQFAYDALLHRQERETAGDTMATSSRAVVLTGWIPKTWVKVLTKRMSKDFPEGAVAVIAKKRKEVPPVALRNSKLVQPFEAVTNIYGKPAYNELDPSSALSLFFLIGFGFALSDAGYGLIMVVAMWAAKRFFRLNRDLKKMVNLLFYAGISTTILGALAGGWFGITLEDLQPGVVRDFLLSMKVIDPVPQLLTLLGVALGFGVIQLLFAWMVRGWDNWKKGAYMKVLLDDIPWITMVVFLLMWVAARQGIFLASSVAVLKWVAILNAAVLALTQGREHKNFILRLGTGVLSLYGLVSFVSDVLSYSRLLALGLATGIIGLVVNLIASMIHESIPVVGVVGAIVVLVGGHAFNLGINALGAFIHSGRLQFVEFFPKFMEGGGAAYSPFGRISKYVDNPNEFK